MDHPFAPASLSADRAGAQPDHPISGQRRLGEEALSAQVASASLVHR